MFKLARNDRIPAPDKTYCNAGDPTIVNHLQRHFSSGKLCLDIGCGSGGNAGLLARTGWVVDGITISPNEASVARAFCRTVAIHNLEQGLPKEVEPESYDVILASHVLEHVFYPDELLSDCWRALRPTGGMVVILPNLLFWRNRVKMALGRFEYQDVGIMDYTHCRWYTFDSARALLQKHGFEVVESIADGHIFAGGSRLTVVRRTLAIMEQVFQRFTPGLIAFQMYFIARKMVDAARTSHRR